jgi:hypothetical protein
LWRVFQNALRIFKLKNADQNLAVVRCDADVEAAQGAEDPPERGNGAPETNEAGDARPEYYE